MATSRTGATHRHGLLGLPATLFLAAAMPLAGQPPTGALFVPQRGVVPFESYSLSQIESVDGVHGNVQFHIPLTQMAPGRAGMTDLIDLYYNSSIYTFYTIPDPGSGGITATLTPSNLFDPIDSDGWRYGFEYSLTWDVIVNPPVQDGSCTGTIYFRYRLITPDGSSHVLYNLTTTGDLDGYYGFTDSHFCDTNPPPVSPATYPPGPDFYTADGTYLHLVLTPSTSVWTLYYTDGRVVTGNGSTTTSISDRNGNTINIEGTTTPDGTTITLADTIDSSRTITISKHDGDNGVDTIVQNGYKGQQLSWSVVWGQLSLSPGHYYNCGAPTNCDAGGGPYPLTMSMVTAIQLPDGLNYSFCYDAGVCSQSQPISVPTQAWGQVTNMYLPEGAQVQYSFPGPGSTPDGTGVAEPVSQKNLIWLDTLVNQTRTEVTNYQFNVTSSVFTNPDGSTVTRSFNNIYDQPTSDPLAGLVYRTDTEAQAGLSNPTPGRIVEQEWALNIPYGVDGSSPGYHLPGNPYVELSVESTAGVLSAPKLFSYDRNGNVTETGEYDWTLYSSISRNNGVPTSTGGANLLRTTQNSYQNGAGAAPSAATIDDPWGYWHLHSPQLLNLVSRSAVTGNGPGAATEFQYDANGNPTQENQWDSTVGSLSTPLNPCPQATGIPSGCNARAITHTYDTDNGQITGSLTGTTDANGNHTQLSYDSNHLCVQSISGARNFQSGPCDLNTSLPLTETDLDHTITRTFNYDVYGRSLSYTDAGSGALTREQQICYSDDEVTQACAGSSASNPLIQTRSDLNTSGDGVILQSTWFDQLGRTRQTEDPAGNFTRSLYYTPVLGGSSYQLVSNPFVSGTEPTMGWTLTTLDMLGRAVAVQHCANPANSAPFPGTGCTGSTGTRTTSYGVTTGSINAATATVTDEAGAVRTSYFDGSGRLVQVTENGSENTSYAYDALDDLTGVTQPNNQTRSFTYSSLKRLLSAVNPENGPIQYANYDGNGNVLTRTQAGITTNYTYDNLNQLTGKSYSDGTPAASWGYSFDWPASTAVSGGATTSRAYDGLGRVTQFTQQTNSATYTFSNYSYNLADSVKSETTPSGRILSTTYDNADRPITVTGVQGSKTTNYASAIGYAPQGAIGGMTLGNLLSTSIGFNSRLQPTTMSLGGIWSLTNNYGTSQNNGNVLSQQLQFPLSSGTATLSTAYAYDGVNRLCLAAEFTSGAPGLGCPSPSSSYCSGLSGAWCRLFNYYQGGNGNRMTYSSTGQGLSADEPASFTANNQIVGFMYDARGNVTMQADGSAIAYDAESRQKQFCAGSACTAYAYDADGRRVLSSGPGGTTVYIYDAAGNPAAENATSPPALSCTTCYVTADHLGSTRVVTDQNGCAQIREDYLPFGQTILPGTGDPRNSATGGTVCSTNGYGVPTDFSPQFTGKERDSETGLDYFGARYFSGAQGRFTSPDAPFNDQHPGDPQSWNLYSYAMNNPLVNIDPTGLDCVSATDSNGGSSVNHDTDSGGCGQAGGTWVPGYVNENWVHFNSNNGQYQVGSIDGAGKNATVDYATFAGGAQTDANGNCTNGCGGYGFASANANGLQGQLVGNSISGGLDGYIQFLTGREQPLGGGLLNRLVSGPLDPSTDHWAGPGGMGPPGGQGDWAASVHDYNFSTNGPSPGQGITIGNYFNPTLSPATSRALIQSNSNLIRNAGGIQGVKMGMFFGVVNAFQWYANSWK